MQPKTTEYAIPLSALFALKQLLPTSAWYADESQQQAKLIVHGVAADEAIGELPAPPDRLPDESENDYVKRLRNFAMTPHVVAWTDAQKQAVKVCVQYYVKKGAFLASPATVRLLEILQIVDEHT